MYAPRLTMCTVSPIIHNLIICLHGIVMLHRVTTLSIAQHKYNTKSMDASTLVQFKFFSVNEID